MATKLIIPGLNGSGEGHWQRHWLNSDADCVLVEQRDWSRPDLREWLLRIEAAIHAHPGAVLVAHSFGALAVAHLAHRPSAELIGSALLVAPCDPERARRLHPGVIGEACLPARRLGFRSLVVGSRNDPYMSFSDVQNFAAVLGAGFVDLGYSGHINIDSGHGDWPLGRELARQLEFGTTGLSQSRFARPDDPARPDHVWSY